MPLVIAAMMPHVWDLVPGVDPNAGGCLETRVAMERVGALFAEKGVESIVVMGPHGIRVDGSVAIVRTGRGVGELGQGETPVRFDVPIDVELADAIVAEAERRSLPAAAVGFGGNRMDQAEAPLDWGTLVPLWFTGYSDEAIAARSGEDGPGVVALVPSRKLSFDVLEQFGSAIGDVLRQWPKNVGLIMSCDWAHTHAESGPYGKHPAAETVDATVLDAVKANKLASLANLDPTDVENAAIDGMWQSLVFAGVQSVVPMSVSDVTYEIAGYVSVIVATYVPDDAS